MIINDQIIFDTFFYLTLGVSLIFGFLSLLLYRNRRRMIFLFLFYALLSLVEFLLFSGVMVFIIGLIFTSFYILLLVFSYNEDVFSAIKKKKSKRGPWEIAARVTNLVAGLAICIGTGYWFYVFTEINIGEIRDIRRFQAGSR